MSRMQFRNAALEGRVLPVVEMREVETTDSLSMLHGLAVPYREWASIGWFMEQFERGSLGKSIKEAARNLPLNLFHENRAFPIGAASEWDERDGGLWGTWKLDGSETAQEAARHAKEGRLTGLSIEFSPIRSEWEFLDYDEWNPNAGPEGMDKVTRIEARLGAVGLVQTPAYVKAGVELVRSFDARRPEQREGGQPGQPAARPFLTAARAELEQLRQGLK